MNSPFKYKKYILTAFSLLIYVVQYAQSIKPPVPTRDHPGEDLPIDAGVFLLGLLAVVYGVIKKK